MEKARLLLTMGKPRVLAAMCLLTLAGAVLSPHFLSPAFPPTRLSSLLAGLFSPAAWSLVRAAGGAVVTGLLWMGTALIHDMADHVSNTTGRTQPAAPGWRIRPSEVLRWALGLQAAGFCLVLLDGSRQALLTALLGAGLGNAYAMPPLGLRHNGPVASLITGGGAALSLAGGMLSQTGVTEVGALTALALGLLAAAMSMVRDFKVIPGQASDAGWTLPALLGRQTAVYVNMALVTGAYLAAMFLLLHTIGMQQRVLGLFGLPLAANLYLLHGLLRETGAEYACGAYARVFALFVGVALLYVGAQAIY
ncbi:MAG TPA: hypothetical protein VD902_21510 [Symbiobacteriaceae bacterium]|nr:hypothetical protein [Symbiobacteriaceae bacterium]